LKVIVCAQWHSVSEYSLGKLKSKACMISLYADDTSRGDSAEHCQDKNYDDQTVPYELCQEQLDREKVCTY